MRPFTDERSSVGSRRGHAIACVPTGSLNTLEIRVEKRPGDRCTPPAVQGGFPGHWDRLDGDVAELPPLTVSETLNYEIEKVLLGVRVATRWWST